MTAARSHLAVSLVLSSALFPGRIQSCDFKGVCDDRPGQGTEEGRETKKEEGKRRVERRVIIDKRRKFANLQAQRCMAPAPHQNMDFLTPKSEIWPINFHITK